MSSSSGGKRPATASSSLTEHARHVSIEPPTIHIDADGDLRLRVGSKTGDGVQDFVVCSRTMGRSSPVWNAMLFGGYKESRPVEGEWVVSLPEDEPDALLMVLNIIHGRFATVPKTLSLKRLYHILALTHKYDMVQKVQPLAASWSIAVAALAEKGKGDTAMLMFVAWELGQEQIFSTLVSDLVMGCSMDSEGRLTAPNGSCLNDFDHFGPHDLIARVCYFREKTIQCLLDIVDAFIRSLTRELPCTWCKALPQNDMDRLACDSTILGSFRESTIKKWGALFPSSAHDIRDSVNTLVIEIFDASGDIICDLCHKQCNPAESLQELVLNTVGRLQSGVTLYHLSYMKERRNELGIPNSKLVRRTNFKKDHQEAE